MKSFAEMTRQHKLRLAKMGDPRVPDDFKVGPIGRPKQPPKTKVIWHPDRPAEVVVVEKHKEKIRKPGNRNGKLNVYGKVYFFKTAVYRATFRSDIC